MDGRGTIRPTTTRLAATKPILLLTVLAASLVVCGAFSVTRATAGFVPTCPLDRIPVSRRMTSTEAAHDDVERENGGSGDSSMTYHHQSPLLLSYGHTPLAATAPMALAAPSAAHISAMIILNAPLGQRPSPLFQRLWKESSFRVCADGGANRLRRATAHDADENHYIPDLIVGDLDSLLPSTRHYYEHAHNVPIVQDNDQNCNDIEKAVEAIRARYVTTEAADARAIRCVIYGAFGGRFDQEMASLQVLYKYATLERQMQFYLYNDQTMALLLPTGINFVYLALPPSPAHADETTTEDTSNVSSMMVSEGPTCGLIPLGGPVERLTLSGFEWDLHEAHSSFGTMVSTSNCIVATINDLDTRFCTASKVMVQCSHPVIFTAQVHAGVVSEWTE